MRRPYDSILWWELRRLPFNGLLLAAGVFSFGVIELIGSRLVKPGDDVVEQMALIAGGAVYVIAANRPTMYRRGLKVTLICG